MFLENEKLINGDYTILLYSVDAAGNKNTNEATEGSRVQPDGKGDYSGEINFILDNNNPILTILGIKDGQHVSEANQYVTIKLSDNSPAGITVYLNGEEVKLSETRDGLVDTANWLYFDKELGEYKLNIVQMNKEQDLRVVAVDAAQNEAEAKVVDFLITTNWFVQFINTPWMVIVAILALAGVTGGVIFVILKKKKQKEA